MDSGRRRIEKGAGGLSINLQWFTKAGQEESLKQAIDLKGQLTAVVMKFSDLNIVCSDSENVKSREDEKG